MLSLSSFYKKNKGILDTLLYLCWENMDRSVYFNDAVELVAETRWELIQIFNELLDQKHEYGYLIDGSLINIEYETN